MEQIYQAQTDHINELLNAFEVKHVPIHFRNKMKRIKPSMESVNRMVQKFTKQAEQNK